jgi:kinesin family protein C1
MERSSAEAKLSEAKVAFELQAAKERADALGSMKESMGAALAEQIAAVEATCESAKEKALEQQKLSMEQEGGETLAEALSKQASELSEEHSQTLQNALEEQKSGLHANAEATMLQKLEEQELQLKNSSDALKEKELSELIAKMKIEMEDLLEKSESLYQEKLKDLGEKQKTLLEETLQFREDELKAEAEAAHSSAVEGLKQKLESDFQEQKNKALEELRAELSTMFEANLEKKMEELTSQLSSAQDSVLQEQKQALTNEYNASKESALQEMKEDLESKFKIEKEQALEELKKELYDGTIAVLNSKIEALEQSKLQHESELDKMNVRLQGALAALQSEKEEVCSLQKQAAEITKDHLMKVEELSSSLADVKKDNLEHVSQLDILNAQLTAIKDAESKSKKQQMEQISDASKEVEESRQHVLGLQDDIEGLKLQIKQGEDRVAVVEGQLLEAEYIRRQLHNQVQELRGNVRVFCRVRPLFKDTDASVQYIDEESMKLTAPSTNNGSLTAETKDWSFSFDKVFNDKSSQSDVFGEVSQLVQSALDGYKVCLFSYGQTGSGKTHTMLGGQGDNKGIIARSVEKIIEASSCLEKKGWKYSMEACFLEIYNETVRDLLQPGTAHSQKYSIQNPKTAGGCPFVAGVEREPVDSVEAANSLVRRASAARAVEATQMNDTSSRSHTIFMLYITGVHKDAGQKLEGCLNLVDLAGSERVSRSGAQGARLRETCAINKSLSSLGDVFTAISARQSHIPFRNSKLTHLLAPCLSGDGKTLMFVNVSPEANDAEETLCSLRFASKVNACELGARGSGAKRNLSSVTPNDATPSQTPAKKTTSAARTTTGARRVSTRTTTSTSSRMRSSSIGMSSPPKRTRVTK